MFFGTIVLKLLTFKGFPVVQMVKNPLSKAKEAGLIPGSGRFPGEHNDNPHQHSCLENSMDRAA